MKKLLNKIRFNKPYFKLDLKMKITILLLFAALSVMHANDAYSQKNKISLNEKNIEVIKVIEKIEVLTDYRFVYNVKAVNLNRIISIKIKAENIDSVLEKIFRNTKTDYKISGNHIILMSKKIVIEDQYPRLQENKEIVIKGRVVDEKGVPLVGATISDFSTGKIVLTDFNGEYEITVLNSGISLSFSYVGFEDQTVKIAGRLVINITLKFAVNEMDELVVIGYGTIKQREATGSVSTIKATVLEKQPTQNPMQTLQGRVAGLLVTTTSGRPGANTQISIRGINSINSGNNPLYIIDGVPFDSTPLNQFDVTGLRSVGYQSPLNSINSSDIESISILKDADATSIYGSRGANGVILITTKRGGKNDEMNFDVNISTGVGEIASKMNLMNTKEYLDIRNRAFANDGYAPDAGSAPDLVLWDQNHYTDWQDLLIGNTALITNGDISFSGGSSKNRFSLAGNYRKETTVYIGDSYDTRLGVHATYDYKSPDDKFGISFSSSYSYDENMANSGDFAQQIFTTPNLKPYDADGNLNFEPGVGTYGNPLSALYSDYENKTDNLIANSIISYTILPKLEAKVSLGYNMNKLDQFYGIYQNAYPAESPNKPSAQFGNTQRKGFTIEPQLNYDLNIGKGNLTALVGSTLQKVKTEEFNAYGTNYSTDALLHSLLGAGTISVYSDFDTDYRYASIFSRLTYNWDKKYIVNGTFRRDGSSRFGPDQRYGNFGSIGAAWLFSEEKLIKDNLSFLSQGKLRSTYGSVGNDQIGNYQYIETWQSYWYNYQGVRTLIPERLGNSNYSWERVRKFDLALELGFLNNNIIFSVNYYKSKTDNQLISYTLPSITGFTSIQANLPAIVENSGWEFELNTNNISNKNFKWNTSFNLTVPKNELVRFDGLETSSYGSSYEIGQPIRLAKGYVYQGTDENGQPKFEDVDGDGIITYTGDRVTLGTTIPKFYGGLSNTFTYKNWSLDFLFQFVKKEDWGYKANLFNAIGTTTNFGQEVYEGIVSDSGEFPSPTTYSPYWYNYVNSTATWGDASYIRLKNAYFSYSLPKTVSTKIGMQNCKFYLQGQNLLTFTKYDGLDPESTGLFTPPLRTYSFGINLSF
jgi:TonB-linked SusC/RagA family outer membrane protein